MATINPHTTRATGTILTATIYNTDHENHISNVSAVNSEIVDLAAKFPGTTIDNTVPRFNGVTGDLQTSKVNIDDSGNIQSAYTGSGAAVGPTLDLYRNSSAPLDGDTIGAVAFSGENSADEIVEYARVVSEIDDQTNGTEDGRLLFQAIAGGIRTTAMELTGSGALVGVDELIDPTANTYGCSLAVDGLATFSRNDDLAVRVKRGVGDGTLMQFYLQTSVEGIISGAGSVITYGTFCGSHWSQVEGDILRGTVVESIDELCYWEGDTNYHLAKCKVSDTPASKSVYGVWFGRDEDGDGLVTGLGAFLVRVRGEVSRGDLLESAGDGTARVQSHYNITSSTIGKVTAAVPAETYPDGSWLVPAVIYCG